MVRVRAAFGRVRGSKAVHPMIARVLQGLFWCAWFFCSLWCLALYAGPSLGAETVSAMYSGAMWWFLWSVAGAGLFDGLRSMRTVRAGLVGDKPEDSKGVPHVPESD